MGIQFQVFALLDQAYQQFFFAFLIAYWNVLLDFGFGNLICQFSAFDNQLQQILIQVADLLAYAL